MIQCPGCGQSLPDTFSRCQFCGADVARVPRPVQAKVQTHYYQPANWVWIAYYGIACWWLIGGAKDVYGGLKTMGRDDLLFPGIGIFGVIVGGVTVCIALGIILRLEFVRAIVNFWNFVKILMGLLSLYGSVTASLFVGPIALLWIFLTILDLASAVMMIYLIGETDKSTG